MDIKTSGIFLSFDDWWIDEWHEILNFLDSYEVKATFYISFDGRPEIIVTPEKWDKLRKMKDAGHTIGFHTVTHFHTPNYIEQHGWEKFEREEILSGVELLRDRGFTIRHFSYPGGHYSDETNRRLGQHFETLRGTEGDGDGKTFAFHEKMTYMIEEIWEDKLIHAFQLDTQPQEIRQAIAMNTDKIICCYTHVPIRKELESFFKFAKEHGINFYSMDVLNKENQGN